ncbi:FAD-dependent oxidoreductase [Sphingomonas jatrophae]|uniref:3-oxosteroid 1-dehydrogenase n=1 Tax=Sphingomonas jatrophae TaxID=1166337 RepID=A0A1I6KHL4_9SPHN|nr:FAD-dependent oxidoreductase [Sphingomonas jatrophae]SFR90654.1 3-oxosteroid 1-dehydrogenase [Sphingomonas jatrophae]
MADLGWDEEVDVLVVGSGAGGLTAAVAAADAHGSVLVIEKSGEYGGTSATSGGGIWIPNSPLGREQGLEDSEEEAFSYLRPQSAPNVPDGVIRAYIRRAPEMLGWLHEKTPVRFTSVPYPDYHVEYPGGKQGFRTHLPVPFDGRQLGADILHLRAPSPAASLFGIINWRFDETYTLLFRPKGWQKALGKMFWRYGSDLPHRFRSIKDRHLTLGNALVGGLRLALKERGVPLRLNTGLVELVREGDMVTGAVVEQKGKRRRIRARRGLVLAAGGFERNAELRRKHLPGSADPTISGSQINNMGDTIVAAEKVGAALRNMHSTWSAPVFRVPGEERARLSTIERALPGCIIVNQAGKRYMNEAASYHVVGRQILENDRPGAGTQPSWVIFDATFRHKYPMGPLLPLIPDALQPKGVRKIMRKADSIEALARQIGMSADALAATVTRFNADAERGVDTEFDRGGPAYDKMYGDARVQPNPTLAPIVKAPFYAFPIYGGDIGTNGGVVTDEDARVLDEGGRPIGGLYAVGNNAASVMGESYPGAGVTLGPAMAFGYVAGRHAMGVND